MKYIRHWLDPKILMCSSLPFMSALKPFHYFFHFNLGSNHGKRLKLSSCQFENISNILSREIWIKLHSIVILP